MKEIKQNFQRINKIKKNSNINNIENDKVNRELNKNKNECQTFILKIREENNFYKIYFLDNILKSSEI